MSTYKLAAYTRKQVAAIDKTLLQDYDDVVLLSDNFTKEDKAALELDALVAARLKPDFVPDWPKRTSTRKQATTRKTVEKKPAVKRTVKPKSPSKPKAVKPKATATSKSKKSEPGFEQNRFSIEIQLMRYLVEQEGELKSLESLKRFWIKAKRAFKQGQIEHKKLFRYLLSKIKDGVKKAEQLKHETMQYSLNSETREKLEAAIKKAKPVMRITYLAGLHGGGK